MHLQNKQILLHVNYTYTYVQNAVNEYVRRTVEVCAAIFIFRWKDIVSKIRFTYSYIAAKCILM